jgi:hypothetical protein
MSLDTRTKLAIYRHFAETGQRPSLQVVAERVRADLSSVCEAYVRLRGLRVFPRPNGGTTLFSPEATCFLASDLRLSTLSYQLSTSRPRRPQPDEMRSIFTRFA